MAMTAFEVIDRALPPTTVKEIKSVVEQQLLVRHPTQSGALLDGAPLLGLLAPLCARIDGMVLRLDKSSYRMQPSLKEKNLDLHQDVAALSDAGELKLPSCTVWLPLQEIDEVTPSLELSPKYPGAALPHKSDENGYSVLSDISAYDTWPRIALTHLPLGSAVLIMPFTLHRTYVKPWHQKIRHSLDLRFLPVS